MNKKEAHKTTASATTNGLPSGTDDLACTYVRVNSAPSIECPTRLPRRAKYIATLEWAWSPAHGRIDRYHLSTNKSRTHWILWFGYFDEDETLRWVHNPRAFCPKKNTPAKTAAMHLLLTSWKGEMAEYPFPEEPFHYITGAGLLSREELNLLAQCFWGVESDAPSPKEIRQNIRENSARWQN